MAFDELGEQEPGSKSAYFGAKGTERRGRGAAMRGLEGFLTPATPSTTTMRFFEVAIIVVGGCGPSQ